MTDCHGNTAAPGDEAAKDLVRTARKWKRAPGQLLVLSLWNCSDDLVLSLTIRKRWTFHRREVLKQMRELARKLTSGDLLSKEQGLELCRDHVDLMSLIWAADKVRQRFFGRKVSFCSIINAKSGRCPSDCIFCAQSSRYGAEIRVYSMMETPELLTAIRQAGGRGVERVGIVTSGVRAPIGKELDVLLASVREAAKEGKVRICCSLGQVDEGEARRLKEAGVTSYHHNLESSPSFYKSVSKVINYNDKIATVRAAKNAGFKTCCGGIFGLGERWEDRVELAMKLRELDVDSVPLNFLRPVKGTPLENSPSLSPREALRIISLFRLMLPDKTIRVCGGREFVLRDMQSWMFHAGANGAILGNYLTTAGRPPEQDLQMIEDLGLEVS